MVSMERNAKYRASVSVVHTLKKQSNKLLKLQKKAKQTVAII